MLYRKNRGDLMKPLDYLKRLEDSGFEAYIVGGYVRDKLLDIESLDVDITTSAKPVDIKRVFNIEDKNLSESIKIDDGKYHLDFTTFRRESAYFNHMPKRIKYINSLKEDLKRRDFTINAICMNSNGEIVDLLKGRKDLENREIRVIGRIRKKFSEDPLRMIRALRFCITYNFKIESKAFDYMMKHKNLFANISVTRKKEELKRFLLSDNVLTGMEFLKNMNFLYYLDIDYARPLIKTDDLISMYAQLDFKRDFLFTKREKREIEDIKRIVNSGIITAYDIYKCGYDLASKAGKILNIKEADIKQINDIMSIHKGEKLAIDGDTIKSMTFCNDKSIKNIKEDLIYQLLSGNLSNDENALKRYIKKHWK